jgi:hypothetical protein
VSLIVTRVPPAGVGLVARCTQYASLDEDGKYWWTSV